MVLESSFFFRTPASLAENAAVNPDGMSTLLAVDVSTFLPSGNETLFNGPRILLRCPPDCIIFEKLCF